MTDKTVKIQFKKIKQKNLKKKFMINLECHLSVFSTLYLQDFSLNQSKMTRNILKKFFRRRRRKKKWIQKLTTWSF